MFDQQQLNQLYQYCLSLTSHSANAYDLLQTALEKFLKQDKRQVESHMGYIRRIIRNQFIDDCRRQQIIAFDPIEDTEALSLETRSLDQVMIEQDLVEKAWVLLNTAEREILYLWAMLGYSSSEIAKELDSPRGTVLSRIHRLKQKLQNKFQEQSTSTPSTLTQADKGGK